MAIDRYRKSPGNCRVIGSGLQTACGRGFKVIPLSGLVVDLRYGTGGAGGAERILRGGVGIAVLGRDVLGSPWQELGPGFAVPWQTW